MRASKLATVIIAISLGIWACPSETRSEAGPAAPHVKPTTVPGVTWEYLVVEYDPRSGTQQDQLNALGEKGWELVAVIAGTSGSGRRINTIKYYLKKRK